MKLSIEPLTKRAPVSMIYMPGGPGSLEPLSVNEDLFSSSVYWDKIEFIINYRKVIVGIVYEFFIEDLTTCHINWPEAIKSDVVISQTPQAGMAFNLTENFLAVQSIAVIDPSQNIIKIKSPDILHVDSEYIEYSVGQIMGFYNNRVSELLIRFEYGNI